MSVFGRVVQECEVVNKEHKAMPAKSEQHIEIHTKGTKLQWNILTHTHMHRFIREKSHHPCPYFMGSAKSSAFLRMENTMVGFIRFFSMLI